jgi:hypothetical protein
MFEAETISGELAIIKLNELCQVINRNLGLPHDEWLFRSNGASDFGVIVPL